MVADADAAAPHNQSIRLTDSEGRLASEPRRSAMVTLTFPPTPTRLPPTPTPPPTLLQLLLPTVSVPATANITVPASAVDANFTPAAYAVPRATGFVEASNAWRPAAKLSLSQAYLESLVAVPVVLLLLWCVLALSVVALSCRNACCACAQPRGLRPKQRKTCARAFAAAMAVAWVLLLASLGVQADVYRRESASIENLKELKARLVDGNASVITTEAVLGSLQGQLQAISAACPLPPSSTRVARMQAKTASLLGGLQAPQAAFSDIASRLTSATDSLQSLFLVRVVVVLTMLCIGIVTLPTTGAVFLWCRVPEPVEPGAKRQRRCCCSCARCGQHWASITLLALALLLTVAVGVAYAAMLILADLCTPNVVVQTGILIGQALKFKPAANANDTVPTSAFCNATASLPNAPHALTAWCYFSTCVPYQLPVSSAEFYAKQVSAIETARELQAATAEALNQTGRSLPPACDNALSTAWNLTATVVKSFAQVEYSVSCRNVNPRVVSVVYVGACETDVNDSLAVVAILLSASILFSVALVGALSVDLLKWTAAGASESDAGEAKDATDAPSDSANNATNKGVDGHVLVHAEAPPTSVLANV